MGFDIKRFMTKRAFNAKTRMRLWRKLAVQVHNSLPVYTAFEAYLKHARRDNSHLQDLFANVLKGRDSGTPLGNAFVGFATPEEIMLLQAGEKAGDIEMGFTLCRELLMNQGVVARTVKSNLAYPCFLLLICVGMVIMVSRMIIPQLGLVYDPEEWTGAAGFLRDIAWFVNSWRGLISLFVFTFLMLLMFWSFPRWTGVWRKRIDNLGPYGIYKTMVGSSWMFTVATLMRSGMQIRTIFEQMMHDPQSSKYLKERVHAIAVQYSFGKNFGDSLYGSGFQFPSKEAVDDMQTYAVMPNMEEHMFDIAHDQMEFDVENIKKKMKGLNVALMFFVFGFIGLTLYGVFSFQQQFAATM